VDATTYPYDSWSRLAGIALPDGGDTGFAYTPSTFEEDHKQDTNNDCDRPGTSFTDLSGHIVYSFG
jgi:hypothetical protein